MAGRISDADKERVRDANRIEAVIGDYVALRSAGGGNLKGLCPFHDEKTPSFYVSPARGTYHCFGCGVGGDVFAFVAEIEHLGFVEAVQRLADRSGVALTLVEGGTSTRAERGTRSRLIAVNKAAAAFYAAQLATVEAEPARAFLSDRGFDASAAEHFGCGYAPSGWDSLIRTLIPQGFSVDELIKAGVARQGRRGPIDAFVRRLVWAIRDAAGDVVGFGARRLFADDGLEAKYVNTAETVLYRKSQVLFGLDLAKRDIARSRQVVVVEGYTDVMAMHLAGVTTAVASCGTAFGEEHISVLRRYLTDSEALRGEVIYTFDGDAAGQKAALRAFESDQRFAANTFVAVAPDGMDPCELRQARGDAALRELIAGRRPLFAFAIQARIREFDLDTAEGRVAARAAAVPLVARIGSTPLREEYARQLAGWLGADPAPLLAQVRDLARRGRAARAQDAGRAHASADAGPNGRAGGNGGPGAPVAQSAPVATGAGTGAELEPASAPDGPARPNPRDPARFAEREVLKLVLQHPDLVAGGYDQVQPEAFTHPAYAAVHDAVLACGGPGQAPAGAAWVERVGGQDPSASVRSLVTELAVEPLRHRSDEPDTHYAGAILARMAERVAARTEGELRSALQRAESSGDAAGAQTLTADLMAIAAYRRALDQRARGEA